MMDDSGRPGGSSKSGGGTPAKKHRKRDGHGSKLREAPLGVALAKWRPPLTSQPRVPPVDAPLTTREKAFVRLVVDLDGQQTRRQIATMAGYSEASAGSTATALVDVRRSPHVVRAIREYQGEIEEQYKVSRQRHLRDLQKIRDAAMGAGKYSAAAAAEYRRGQAAEEPIYVERKEVRTGSLDQMTREEVEAELRRLRDEWGMGVIEGESSPVAEGGEGADWLEGGGEDADWLEDEDEDEDWLG